jgi:hypothetical protein
MRNLAKPIITRKMIIIRSDFQKDEQEKQYKNNL